MAGIRLKVFDNYAPNIDEIRNYALQADYFSPKLDEHFLGFRTRRYFHTEDNVMGRLISNVIDTLNIEFFDGHADHKLRKHEHAEGHFHWCPKESEVLAGPAFDMQWHRDYITDHAGVMYLNLEAPENTGTSFTKSGKVYEVDNIYNRLLLYDSNILHTPQHFFGDTIENGRLTFVFFSRTYYGVI